MVKDQGAQVPINVISPVGPTVSWKSTLSKFGEKQDSKDTFSSNECGQLDGTIWITHPWVHGTPHPTSRNRTQTFMSWEKHFVGQRGLALIKPINDQSFNNEHFPQYELWRGDMTNPRTYSSAETL